MLKTKNRKIIDEMDTIFSFKDESCISYNQIQSYTTVQKDAIFLPGIPGLSSEYFTPLARILRLPTNVWRIDLPGNGRNIDNRFKKFDTWLNGFPRVLQRFDRPILISHSFGGMISLMLPQIERSISGMILLNTGPSLPKDLKIEIPSCVENYAFNEKPARWLEEKLIQTNYKAAWVPTIPTLILGGKMDSTIPFRTFQKDARFQKPNIVIKTIPESGHFCWHDNPLSVRKTIYDFLSDFFEMNGF